MADQAKHCRAVLSVCTGTFIEHMAGEKTAGKIQLGAEYYPSGRSYGMMHQFAQAPEYVRQWPHEK